MNDGIRQEDMPIIRKLWNVHRDFCIIDINRFNSDIGGATGKWPELEFDYGFPIRLHVKGGSYGLIHHPTIGNTTDEFMLRLKETFDLNIIFAKRDESKTSIIDAYTTATGPRLALKERGMVQVIKGVE